MVELALEKLLKFNNVKIRNAQVSVIDIIEIYINKTKLIDDPIAVSCDSFYAF